MKKILIMTLLAALGLVSCSSCQREDTTTTVDASDVSSAAASTSGELDASASTQTISEDNWSLTIPEGWERVSPPAPQIKLFFAHMEKRNLILLVKEPFAGSYEEYVLEAVRGLRDGSGRMLAATQVDLNGKKFVLVEAELENAITWTWIYYEKGFGYALSCGGYTNDLVNQEICETIAQSLILK